MRKEEMKKVLRRCDKFSAMMIYMTFMTHVFIWLLYGTRFPLGFGFRFWSMTILMAVSFIIILSIICIARWYLKRQIVRDYLQDCDDEKEVE